MRQAVVFLNLVAGLGVAASTALAAPEVQSPQTPPAALDVWMLDVGQGSCVYIDCPEDRDAILVDCGSTRIGGTPRDRVVSWLNGKTEEAAKVSVIVSHGDVDHYSMLAGLDATDIDSVWLGGVREDYGAATGATARWLTEVTAGGGAVELFPANSFSRADRRFGCARASVDILTASYAQSVPDRRFQSRKNADSAVVRVSFGGQSVILPGDAEGATQRAALHNAARGNLPLANPTVVMGSHHGARTQGSNDAAWIDALRPSIGAFSASLEVSFRHPQCEVVGRFEVHARRAGARFPVSCGVGDRRDVRYVRGAVVSTHDNGHVLFRLTSGRITVLCQRMTPACDGALEPSLLP